MPTTRRCLDCGKPTRNGSRCPRCAHTHEVTRMRELDARRGTATQRGYGKDHAVIRAILRDNYPLGPCHRCGKPGTWNDDDPDPLQAGHIDHQGGNVPANYAPEHRSCNVTDANRRRAR